MRKDKIEKEIEYEDAPSGYVKFYNYKEPLMRFEQGFGYLGAVIFDGDTDKIQCHLCGEWYGQLAHHLHREHNMNVSHYKDIVGLQQSTALISEGMREKLIRKGLGKRMKNLRPGKSPSDETREKIRNTLKKNLPERKNLTNTCPAQLIDRLIKKAEELGRTPTYEEMDCRETLRKTFGSYPKACQMAGLEPIDSHAKIRKYTQQTVSKDFRDFFFEYGKWPKRGDMIELNKLGSWEFARKFGMVKIRKLAVGKGERFEFKKQQLIDFLIDFKKRNGRNPSISDAKRGLLPRFQKFYYYFGDWNNSLKQAGLK